MERNLTKFSNFYLLIKNIHNELNLDSAEFKKNLIQFAYSSIVSRYNEEGRYYHTLKHINHMFNGLNKIKKEEVSSELKMAIWLHDLIYNTNSKGNEEMSSLIGINMINIVGIRNTDFSDNVRDIILSTKIGATLDTPEKKLMHDLDYLVFVDNYEKFHVSCQNIRKEYSNMDPTEYKKGRLSFLDSLTEKDIFVTEYFRELESIAKSNIEKEINFLFTNG